MPNEHEHEHVHTHTYTHTHEHEHVDGTEHEHDHMHSGDVSPEERTRALLAYMIDHNDHHANELAELLESLDGAPKKKLQEAVGSFEVANTQLHEVLDLLTK